MRLVHGIKDLIRNYHTIMPTYLMATFLLLVISNAFPVLGTIVFLPMTIGIAFVMIRAISSKQFKKKRIVTLGFRHGYYMKNVYYLLLKQLAFYLPILAGGVVSGLFLGLYGNFETSIGVTIFNLVLFSIPSALIALMFAMVPYLLADPKFNQRNHNPLKVSARIMKGHYLRLILIRLFFLPWLALNVSSIAVVFSSFYTSLFNMETPAEGFLTSSLLLIPLMYLLFLPWYRMMHAELYVTLRDKVKGYQ